MSAISKLPSTMFLFKLTTCVSDDDVIAKTRMHRYFKYQVELEKSASIDTLIGKVCRLYAQFPMISNVQDLIEQILLVDLILVYYE